MTLDSYGLVVVTAVWAVAVFLYYHAGKRRGYADGYVDGIKQGHANVIAAFETKATYLEDVSK